MPAATQRSIISARRSDDRAVSFGTRTIAGLRRAAMRTRTSASKPRSSNRSPARSKFGHIRLISTASTYGSTANKLAAIVSAENPPILANTGTLRALRAAEALDTIRKPAARHAHRVGQRLGLRIANQSRERIPEREARA